MGERGVVRDLKCESKEYYSESIIPTGFSNLKSNHFHVYPEGLARFLTTCSVSL